MAIQNSGRPQHCLRIVRRKGGLIVMLKVTYLRRCIIAKRYVLFVPAVWEEVVPQPAAAAKWVTDKASFGSQMQRVPELPELPDLSNWTSLSQRLHHSFDSHSAFRNFPLQTRCIIAAFLDRILSLATFAPDFETIVTAHESTEPRWTRSWPATAVRPTNRMSPSQRTPRMSSWKVSQAYP
jgi:hypothetical protein